MKQLIALLLILAGMVYACSEKKKEKEEVIDCGCQHDVIEGEVDGMKAKFRIAYITQEQRWLYDSETLLMDSSSADEAISKFIPRFPGVKTSIGLIAVGAASQEGERTEEDIRAEKRADKIMSKLRLAPESNIKELYRLNLGQFVSRVDLTNDRTDYQRRIIMIGIMEKDERLTVSQIGQCLQNAVQSPNGLNFNTNNYSLFDFTKMN